MTPAHLISVGKKGENLRFFLFFTNFAAPKAQNHFMSTTVADIASFRSAGAHVPILDVRSPGEYAHGHIPGAISFPLFTDEERAKVGTRYKLNGKDSAFLLGLEFVGPKMAGFVKKANKIAPNKKIRVHCWRGGQRSGSMAWLLRGAGFEVQLLSGGYKNYRQYILDAFAKFALDIRVVGG